MRARLNFSRIAPMNHCQIQLPPRTTKEWGEGWGGVRPQARFMGRESWPGPMANGLMRTRSAAPCVCVIGGPGIGFNRSVARHRSNCRIYLPTTKFPERNAGGRWWRRRRRAVFGGWKDYV